jgi:hypothetical protein
MSVVHVLKIVYISLKDLSNTLRDTPNNGFTNYICYVQHI